MSYRDLKTQLMMGFDPGDRWGSAMGMFFDVTEELDRRGADIPPAWGYRCGALGVGEPETYDAEVITELNPDDEDLLRLGNVLHRYTGMLDRAGHSY